MASTFSTYSERHHPWRNGARWTASRDKKFQLRLVAPSGSDRPNRLVLLDPDAQTLITDVVRLRGSTDPSTVFTLARAWWTNQAQLRRLGVVSHTFEVDATGPRPALAMKATLADRPGASLWVPAGYTGVMMRDDLAHWDTTARALCEMLATYTADRDATALTKASNDLVFANLPNIR